jgi:3-methylfumaryl-CoA hydratase
MADWQEWIGRTETTGDDLSVEHARGLVALLDRDPAGLAAGLPLPECWHWIYFRPATPQSGLGPDGHARRGGFLPPIALPRRMWVGGRIRFAAPLPLGRPAVRRSTIASVVPKSGRSGELVFVTVRHEISAGEGDPAAITEEQDLVYRDAAPAGQAGSSRAEPAPAAAAWSERYRADAVALFRFSALTFNGHRIHYDHPYATAVEGYPGVVVHAPLTALLLMDAAVRHREGSTGRPIGYQYRAVSPLFADEDITLAGTSYEDGSAQVWATGPRGLAMTATVEWES